MNIVRVFGVGLLGLMAMNGGGHFYAVTAPKEKKGAFYADAKEKRSEPLHTPANTYGTILASGSTGTSGDYTSLIQDMRIIYAQMECSPKFCSPRGA